MSSHWWSWYKEGGCYICNNCGAGKRRRKHMAYWYGGYGGDTEPPCAPNSEAMDEWLANGTEEPLWPKKRTKKTTAKETDMPEYKPFPFECPPIEPLLNLIGAHLNMDELHKLTETLEGAPPTSPMGRTWFLLKEFADNLHMYEELEGFTSIDDLDPQHVIDRFGLFSDTMEVCGDIASDIEINESPSPIDLLRLRDRRTVSEAVVANLALYGLFSLVANKAHGYIESEQEAKDQSVAADGE